MERCSSLSFRVAVVASVALLVVTSLVLGQSEAGATGTNPVVQKAADWIKAQQQPDGGFEVAGFAGFETPDAVLAIAEAAQTTNSWLTAEALAAVQGLAYGGSGPTPLDYLDDFAESSPSISAGQAAKLIVLNVLPLGLDPFDFDPSGDSPDPVDLVAKIDGGCHENNASFGFFSATLFAILAKKLICGTAPPAAIQTVRNAQQANGGWNFMGDPSGTEVDVDTTGLAIAALVAGGADSSDMWVSPGLNLLARNHRDSGGWDSPFAPDDPNSTAAAVLGITAAGYDVTTSCWRDTVDRRLAGTPYTSPDHFFAATQTPAGNIASPADAWGLNTFATSQSVEALGRKWLPTSRAPTKKCPFESYLAEGATDGGFETWVLLTNPDEHKPATATLTFMTTDGEKPGPSVEVPAKSRRTVRINDYVTDFNVSTIVSSDRRILAERAMYSAREGMTGAHLGKEVLQPLNTWYLPEGAAAGGFETWILVANPGNTTSDVRVTFMTGEGEKLGPGFQLPAKSRRSIRVNDFESTFDVSTMVMATGTGVIAERATYVSHPPFRGATVSPGTGLVSSRWYMAEGATDGGFETWILVANPDSAASVQVSTTFLTSQGEKPGPDLDLGPRSRKSIRVNDYVTDFDVSTRVESTGGGILAERALYSNHPSLGVTASTGEAVSFRSRDWYLVEGATAGGFETWVLVANPDDALTAEVQVDFLTGESVVRVPSFVVDPGRRRSVRVNDFVDTFDVSSRVRSKGAKVIADHSVYAPPGPTRDATSGPGLVS